MGATGRGAMTLHSIVRAAILSRYPHWPREEIDALTDEIVHVSLEHLHETGALSVPPETISRTIVDPRNKTP